jgi:hypothetical protein
VNARRLLVLIGLCLVCVPGSSALAAYPGAAGRIVFVSDRAGSSTWDIYSAAADGTDVQRLTMWAGATQEPVWSPDGSRIAYASSFEGRFRLFVMNQDGSGQHLVSPAAAGSTVDDRQPAWSPDGTKIAFASTRPFGASWHVWVMNADGANLRMLPGDLSQHPAWSPDGSQIAGDAGGSAIFVINADGTNERRLATAPQLYNDESPDWSPDGATLVFSQSSWSGTSSTLRTVAADGSGERQLLTGGAADSSPSFSPDATRVVFVRRTTSDSYQLFTVGAGGGDATQLFSSSRSDLQPNWGSVTSSPPPADAPTVQIFNPTGTGLYFQGMPATFVYYTCNSQVSLVISCNGSQPVAATLDTSSAGLHRFSVTATDVVGRQRTVTVIYTVLDITAPTVSLNTPSDGANYEVGDKVTVDFACSDGAGGSGIQYCSATQPNATPLDTSRIGTFTFQAFALDQAFNGTTRTVTYRVVDSRPPSISITTPADGASYGLGDHLAVNYSCADTGSGVQSCTGTSPSGTELDTSQTGSYSFRVTASDAAGNTTTTTTTYTIVDRTPPSIVITTPADGAVYTQNDAVTADYSCADQPAGSGLLSCNGDLAAGAHVDTNTVGSRTFTVSATDNANNTATKSSSYRVVYGFAGFSQPVGAFPTANSVKAGEAIPLKFSLHGNRGNDVLSANSTTWTPCGSSAATTAAGSLSYNASLDRYTFLATTNKAWAGTCADLTLMLRDGTAHQARFTFGK